MIGVVLVDELPEARWHDLHRTAGVAWDQVTEEEGCRVGILPSVVENRGGVSAALTGEGFPDVLPLNFVSLTCGPCVWLGPRVS
jgi:hypothetical protein